MTNLRTRTGSLSAILLVGLFVLAVEKGSAPQAQGRAAAAPSPLLSAGKPVDWWFVFKFNGKSFPGCGTGADRTCTFGGTVQPYKAFSQQFAYASSARATLQQGSGCAGTTTTDPLGATFAQVYDGTSYYVIWNDQFYNDPMATMASPWGHSKGMVAWNNAGEGFVLQVSTPSWPASGSKAAPRKTDGNTLGCVKDDDVEVSQHFFALKITKDDLAKVLKAIQNASVVTDPSSLQVVKNGGPADIQALVKALGKESASTTYTKDTLSSGVQLISKPSKLHVPPWQLVSAALGGVPLRTATWWAAPKIPTTTASTKIACWDNKLGKPGAVEIATSGSWAGTTIGLEGGSGPEFNHAKIGVSTAGSRAYAIFGDMNQQGTLSGTNCGSSQDGRGGLFYVVENSTLSGSIRDLIKGDTAPQ